MSKIPIFLQKGAPLSNLMASPRFEAVPQQGIGIVWNTALVHISVPSFLRGPLLDSAGQNYWLVFTCGHGKVPTNAGMKMDRSSYDGRHEGRVVGDFLPLKGRDVMVIRVDKRPPDFMTRTVQYAKVPVARYLYLTDPGVKYGDVLKVRKPCTPRSWECFGHLYKRATDAEVSAFLPHAGGRISMAVVIVEWDPPHKQPEPPDDSCNRYPVLGDSGTPIDALWEWENPKRKASFGVLIGIEGEDTGRGLRRSYVAIVDDCAEYFSTNGMEVE